MLLDLFDGGLTSLSLLYYQGRVLKEAAASAKRSRIDMPRSVGAGRETRMFVDKEVISLIGYHVSPNSTSHYKAIENVALRRQLEVQVWLLDTNNQK